MNDVELREKLHQLFILRQDKARHDADRKVLKAAYEAQPAVQANAAQTSSTSEAIALAEAGLRNEALARYHATQEKKILGGALGIKVGAEYCYDLKAATDWAKVNAPVLLVLDEQALHDMVKGMKTLPDFVTKQPVTTATIATDLSAYAAIEEVKPTEPIDELPF